jgi:uncharacterized membrane protein
MKYLTTIGRIFFCLAFIGLGIEHFVLQDFISGRAPPWPEGLPGRLVWAYGTGVVIVLASLAIVAGKQSRAAALLIGTLIVFWALLRHIPVVASDALLAPTWTAAGKALTFVGGSLAIAATSPPLPVSQSRFTHLLNLGETFILASRICLGIFLIVTGIQHFIYTEFVASLIPNWFPGNAVFWTYFAGVTLISGGAGLFVPQTAELAALLSGLMVFAWFWIVHIPRTFGSVSDGIAVFEALAVSGIGLVIAGFLHQRKRGHALAQPPVRRSA